MTNTNCLAGIKCPECGNEDRFLIVSTITASVTDNGAEISDNYGDIYWDATSPIECPDCEHAGLAGEFRIDQSATGSGDSS